MSTAEIARKLNIRYQFAYKVLRSKHQLPATVGTSAIQSALRSPSKPKLIAQELLACGFHHAGKWALSSDGQLIIEGVLPKAAGVYAFARAGEGLYVGVATMGLDRRIRFYRKPGSTQRTSLRVNALLKAELRAGQAIDIYIATPSDLEWNGLPIHGSAGLELGLIKKFSLPWNMRSAG